MSLYRPADLFQSGPATSEDYLSPSVGNYFSSGSQIAFWLVVVVLTSHNWYHWITAKNAQNQDGQVLPTKVVSPVRSKQTKQSQIQTPRPETGCPD